MIEITIIGNLTKDPEVKALKSGTSVTMFDVAVNQRRGNAAYFKVSTFAGTAEACSKYLRKGRKVAVRGELDVAEKDGRTYLNVRGDGVEFMPNKTDDSRPVQPVPQQVTADDFQDIQIADIPY